MTSNNVAEKEDLILSDITQSLLYEDNPYYREFTTDPTEMEERVPVKIDATYLKVYAGSKDKYQRIFAYLHQRLNELLKALNERIGRNYLAHDSRGLISITETINNMIGALSNIGITLELNTTYSTALNESSKFLRSSLGSDVPNDFVLVTLDKYNPIFCLSSDSSAVTKSMAESLKPRFDSAYMNKQIDQMVESIDRHPSDAIGKAKELIESCCKTILKDYDSPASDETDIPALIKEVKAKLGLDSGGPAAQKIIGSMSGAAAGLAQLRNASGTGHGKSANGFKEPSTIEARLAADTAVTLIHFYWDLHISKLPT